MSKPIHRKNGVYHEITPDNPVDRNLHDTPAHYYEYEQTNHGFSALFPIYFNAIENIWKPAKASNFETLSKYIVVEIIDANNFICVQVGRVNVPGHGLALGILYYSSSTVPGALTTTEPVLGYSDPVLFAEDSEKIHILNYRPLLFGSLSTTYTNDFNEITNITKEIETNILSVEIPVDYKFTFNGAIASGSSDGEYRIYFDTDIQSYKRTAWTDRNADFKFEKSEIASGTIIKISVYHKESTVQSFHANIYGKLEIT